MNSVRIHYLATLHLIRIRTVLSSYVKSPKPHHAISFRYAITRDQHASNDREFRYRRARPRQKVAPVFFAKSKKSSGAAP